MEGGVKTTCPYCGVGCGVIARPGPKGWTIEGDKDHPANFGKLCSKGAMLADMLDPGPRLTRPVVDGRETEWETAITATADRLRATIAAHGPGSVAFYVSGQMLTEDYYVVNKLAKGFLGTPHVDTNSRLCMASTVVGHRRAFGEDVVPGAYEDLDEADLIVLVGSNLAWCHPILHRRVEVAARRGAKLVVIDPRRTDSCDGADLHLAIRPGGDVALFNTLLLHLADGDALDLDWIEAHTRGLNEALAAARTDAPRATEAHGLSPSDLEPFLALFTATEKVVTVFSQGVNQSASGSDKVNAILNVHLATGRIGRPGMGPFSVTGQPNAMGGREVGGLANQLAAHLNPDDPADHDRLRRFWGASNLKAGHGLKAVDLFHAVKAGKIKALWIMATNPAVSLPDSALVREALALCPTVIVSDVVADTDTARHAHILLPAAAWGEKDGTVTNSERRISRQRGFLPAPGEARPDWVALRDVARALGYGAAFDHSHPAEIFAEHAALSAFENEGARVFNLGALSSLSRAAYDALEPVQWPVTASAPNGTARLFADGGFPTKDGCARLFPVRWIAPKSRPSDRFPLVLNTGRYRDQWHTMTRTGLSARLAAHRSEPTLDIHPEDALAHGLAEGGLAVVSNDLGRVTARVRVTEGQGRGQVFLPIHWTDGFSSAGVVSGLMAGTTDPLSGQPESKFSPVAVAPLGVAREGLLFTRTRVIPGDAVHWTRMTLERGDLVTLAQGAGAGMPQGTPQGTPQRAPDLRFEDLRRDALSAVWLDEGRLEAVLYVGPLVQGVNRAWVADRLDRVLEGGDRAALLAGRPAGPVVDRGRTVCSCMRVGEQTILAAIAQGAATVDTIATRTQAGTGCGSCRAEIGEILNNAQVIDHAAE
ncbi:MAG: molybdopterin-dependent oxidoreductase [Rhodospirillum sp.]|nr:molybdopterin-dependent oxidoreductase [Rhodospirillum sp.]MCF8488373.1 molybdopterin-dependent oxidoreductase [Rhodospirillum sp.]